MKPKKQTTCDTYLWGLNLSNKLHVIFTCEISINLETTSETYLLVVMTPKEQTICEIYL